MIIKVYVSCCGGDKAIAVVDEAMKQAGVEGQVEIVKDLAEMAKSGIMSTPAIKINDRLMGSGRIPKVSDLVSWLIEADAKSK
jgi:hypothetical protein